MQKNLQQDAHLATHSFQLFDYLFLTVYFGIVFTDVFLLIR